MLTRYCFDVVDVNKTANSLECEIMFQWCQHENIIIIVDNVESILVRYRRYRHQGKLKHSVSMIIFVEHNIGVHEQRNYQT